jgi:flagellar motor protein MotB
MKQQRLKKGTKHASALWLVSFGDILTLLLAFFAGAIGLSTVSEQKKATESKIAIQDNTTYSENGEEEPLYDLSGIALADRTMRPDGNVPVLYLDDLDLQVINREKMQGLRDMASDADSTLLVEACSPHVVQSRQDANQRIVQVVQLVKEQAPELLKQIRARPLADLDCQRLREESYSLAVIRIVGLKDGRGRRRKKERGHI